MGECNLMASIRVSGLEQELKGKGEHKSELLQGSLANKNVWGKGNIWGKNSRLSYMLRNIADSVRAKVFAAWKYRALTWASSDQRWSSSSIPLGLLSSLVLIHMPGVLHQPKFAGEDEVKKKKKAWNVLTRLLCGLTEENGEQF